MNQELNLIIATMVSCGLSMGIYMLATKKSRALTARYFALSNAVWQVQASLRTRDWEADHMQSMQGSNTRANGYDLMNELTALAEECIQHRDVAKAWLLIGRIGYTTVQWRCDMGEASVRQFNRKLRQYDSKSTN